LIKSKKSVIFAKNGVLHHFCTTFAPLFLSILGKVEMPTNRVNTPFVGVLKIVLHHFTTFPLTL